MGLFDYLHCEYPLPHGGNEVEFQTKDTPSQYCDHYKIDVNGALLYEEHEVEDRGEKSASSGSLERISGCMTKVNKRWEPCAFTGAVNFYGNAESGEWLEFVAFFENGALLKMIDQTKATEEDHEG